MKPDDTGAPTSGGLLTLHLTRAQAEQYVLGALEPSHAARLEAHVVDCSPCAQLLQQEAALELSLHALARRPLVTAEEAGAWVVGALAPEAAAALEAHVVGCAPCADVLAGEARAEAELVQVAQAARPRARVLAFARRHLAPALPALTGVGVAAASALLVFLPLGSPGTPAVTEDLVQRTVAAEQVVVACPDPSIRESCMVDATQRGLMVQYPESPDNVPRYEGASASAPVASGPAPL